MYTKSEEHLQPIHINTTEQSKYTTASTSESPNYKRVKHHNNYVNPLIRKRGTITTNSYSSYCTQKGDSNPQLPLHSQAIAINSYPTKSATVRIKPEAIEQNTITDNNQQQPTIA